MGDRIRDAIHHWEPRALDPSVEVQAPGYSGALRQIDVVVGYTVRGTDERRELSDRIGLF